MAVASAPQRAFPGRDAETIHEPPIPKATLRLRVCRCIPKIFGLSQNGALVEPEGFIRGVEI